MTELTVKATDEGTYIIKAAFSDDEGAFTPTSINWSLSLPDGSIVNSRLDVSVTPAYIAGSSDTASKAMNPAGSDILNLTSNKLIIYYTPISNQLSIENFT